MTASARRPGFLAAKLSKCWFGNKQCVFVAYRHDLSVSELNFSHRGIYI